MHCFEYVFYGKAYNIGRMIWEKYHNYFSLGLVIIFLILSFYSSDAQYIQAIHDYKPAPGQFINSGGGTIESALGIIGDEGGLVSLGAFGGYIIFSFDQPVDNDPENPYGVDFVIFGNATEEFSEPGIVSVMKDDNLNGEPDDIWYELSGSDHTFSSTIKNYTITYTDPLTDFAHDVFWEDSLMNSGFVFANSFHEQSYYPDSGFDREFYNGNCSFTGTKIDAITDFSDVFLVKSLPRKYGYADNIFPTGIETELPDNPYTDEIEGMGGDAMDISWATDSTGNNVILDRIHFIKVHTGVLGDAGPLGELSTEISFAVDIAASPVMSNDIQVQEPSYLVKVFPNPFIDQIHISGLIRGNIEISGAEGRVLYIANDIEGDHVISAGELTPGIYFLKIHDEQRLEFFTLIKAGY